ncbi:uncharacterized protein OCT59_016907 [Rhizophagus irregularis]|uniref:uncharacterized protein n=1 Tax=Rhizophagus irregularis TaxID=588596 RepID=UPI003332163E|nr:hypothetical protein OCT59_016907 [Rhizophagus irregularis]
MEILEELLNRVENLNHAIYMEYHRKVVGLKYLPCALMEERLLKRRACDNGNLDTFYGLHKYKTVCINSISKDLVISSSNITI